MSRTRARIVEQRDRIVRRARRNHDRTESLAILAPLLQPYTPWSSSAMTPIAIRELCNDVVVNDRRSILELGAGVSSIVLCRLADQLDLDVRINSVDEDEGWLDRVGAIMSPAERARWRPIYAPMTSGRLRDGSHFGRWYDAEIVGDALTDPLDLVVCDGPSAYTPEWRDDRFTALGFSKDLLVERHAVLIDDTNRAAERRLARTWAAATPGSYFVDRSSHCWILAGGSMNFS